MKLIMLPGMDGTGHLFCRFVEAWKELQSGEEIEILDLPDSGPQDYLSLARNLIHRLPDSDFVLLAESISGPIAALLASGIALQPNPNIKGLVFVATFLSPPQPRLAAFTRLLPLSRFLDLPGSSLILRHLLLGKDADAELLGQFRRSVAALTNSVVNAPPDSLLKARLNTVINMQLNLRRSTIPTVYLQAKQDLLVPSRKFDEFQQYFPVVEKIEINCPHFALQAGPGACSSLVHRAMFKRRNS